jgi:hypothetical protein
MKVATFVALASAASAVEIYSTDRYLSSDAPVDPTWSTVVGSYSTNDFKHQYTNSPDIEGVGNHNSLGALGYGNSATATWYKKDLGEYKFVTKTALTCKSCPEGHTTKSFWEGNRFGYKGTSTAAQGDSDVVKSFNCDPATTGCVAGYHQSPIGGPFTTCAVDQCNDEEDCGKVAGSGPLASNQCRPNAKNGVALVTNEKRCQCGNLNLDPDEKCGKCLASWTNFPFCNHKETLWVSAQLCNSGTVNDDYFAASNPKACGSTSCGPTQKCCSQGTDGYYSSSTPWSDANPATTYVAKKSAATNARCIDKHEVCCGTATCQHGRKCLDPKRSVCLGWADSSKHFLGLKACYADSAKLNNGTFISNSVTPASWCGEYETCCDGTCCAEGSTCEDKGKVRENSDIYTANQNTFGWDAMYSGGTRVKGKYCTEPAGPTQNWNPMHGMHVVVLPLFLTFAFVLGALLTLKSKAIPKPIQILSVVSFVLCIFNAYHHTWRYAVVTSVIVFFTAAASGSKNKSAWMGVLVMLGQLLLLYVFFDLGALLEADGASIDAVAWPPGMSGTTGGLAHSVQPSRNSPTGGYGVSQLVSRCVNEYNYFLLDFRAVDWDFEIGNGGINMSFGYCEVGWLATMKFFQAVHALVLLAIMYFSAAELFTNGSSTSNKVSPEVEAP